MADISIPQFRADYPEFSDTSRYTDSSVQGWITVASAMLDPVRWGSMLDLGEELFVAHHLVLADYSAKEAALGNTPGYVKGPLVSKSVGPVSMSYGQGLTLENAGHWNLSTYGIQFRTMMRMFGAGPVHVI